MDQFRQFTTFFERSDKEIMLKAAVNLPPEFRLIALTTSDTPTSEPGISPSPTPSPSNLNPSAFNSTPTNNPIPTASFTPEITEIPDYTDTPIPTDTPEATSTSILEPTLLPSATVSPPSPTSPPAPTRKARKKANAGPGLRPAKVSLDDRWVDVDLSNQTTYAMQGDQVVRSFLVSTGRWPTVTIEGVFKIYVKYHHADMTGDDYFLPDVPYVMYFFKGYGLHGTYWHNNFGTPMSHGCVNLDSEDAGWLFDFAPVGTIVSVHQ